MHDTNENLAQALARNVRDALMEDRFAVDAITGLSPHAVRGDGCTSTTR